MRKVNLEAELTRLVETANQEINMGFRKTELNEVLATLKTKNATKLSLRQKFSSDEYLSFSPEALLRAEIKVDRDLLVPAFEEQAEKAKKDSELAQIFIETYCGKQINIMRAISQLESQIAAIVKRSEKPTTVDSEEIVFSEEAQSEITRELNAKKERLIALRNRLDGSAFDIAASIISKVLSDSKSRSSSKKAKSLKDSLVAINPAKPTSDEKWLDGLALDSLEAEIDSLIARKKLLETAPEELAKKILELSTNGNQEEAMMELKNLELLATGTSVGLASTMVSKYITVEVADRSLNNSKRKQTVQKTRLAYLQKSGSGKLSEIAKMVSSICACLYLINESELTKEKITAEKFKAENSNDLKGLATLRKSSSEIETIIKALKDLMADYYLSIEETLSYTSENLGAQALQEYLVGQTSIEISQIESGLQATTADLPIESSIQALGAKAMLIGKHYELPAKHEDLAETISEQAAGTSMVADFKAPETYDLNPEPRDEEELHSAVPDVSLLEPNSFVDTQRVDPAIMMVKATETSLNVEPKPGADIKAKENNESGLGTAQQPPVSTPERPIYPASIMYPKVPAGSDEETKKPDLKPISLAKPLPPISTEKEPIYPASVMYDNQPKESGKELQKEDSKLVDDPIPTSEVKTADTYTPYQQRTGVVIPFKIGTPPSPNPRVVSGKGVKFEKRLVDLAISKVFGNLEERPGYNL